MKWHKLSNPKTIVGTIAATSTADSGRGARLGNLLDPLEEGLPIEAPKSRRPGRVLQILVSRTPATALRTRVYPILLWIFTLGLGLGGAMAALLFRHRVEVILARLL